MQLAANLSFLFTELPFPDRLAAAADAGFTGVEWGAVYDHDPDALAARAAAAGVEVVLINAPAGDPSAGDRGLAAVPGREAEYRAGLELALRHARALGCPRVHVMAGSGNTDEATYRDNLAGAVELFGPYGVTALVEPLNPHDMPGYHLSSAAHAVAVVAAVAGVRYQCDLYHAARVEDDPLAVLATHLDVVGHVQVAGAPARHEPDAALVHGAVAAGWDGWVGCEYRPAGSTTDGLGWARSWLGR